jgi:type VI secretion system protein ImpH
MATPGGRTDPPLEQVLFAEPYRFDFFQAVRLLERLAPGRVPVGREGPPGREVVRFRADPTLAFPASAIRRLDRPDDPDAPPAMTVASLGLTGPLGVLPYVYTELLLERRRQGDRTLSAFFDLFNHRVAALFYRAWEKAHVAAAWAPGADDRCTRSLFSLIGLGIPPLRGRHDFPDEVLLSYAGLLARRHRPAGVLEDLLRDAFGLPIAVHQFVGQWLGLEPGDRSRLGAAGPHNALGVSLILGRRVWDEQGKFRLRVGPLGFAQFRALLPEAPAFRRLTQMTRLFVDGGLDFDVQLVLRADEVPPCRLTSVPGAGPRLGRYAWLDSGDRAADADEAVFAPGA